MSPWGQAPGTRPYISAVHRPTAADVMNPRLLLLGLFACLLACPNGLKLKAADAPTAAPANAATIFYSSAPWDGAAYALEIPLKPTGDAEEPYLRISIWDNPEFPDPRTMNFTGKEDSGGGPSRGEGRALFQRKLDKSMPERLTGKIWFKILTKDSPVLGTYEFATMDGKRVFKGSFQAAWGNKPQTAIR